MRWIVLAVALVVASASPALAGKQQQKKKVSRTPSRHATYAPTGVSPVKFAGDHVVTHESGCTSCGHGSTGCDHGCDSCQQCCLPPLLPNLVDNVVDVFARFKPCPGQCAPCVRQVHCCPYPKTMPPTNHCHRRMPGIMDTILACNLGLNKGCRSCNSGCTSCAKPCCSKPRCTSCTQPGCMSGAGGPYTEELIAPPTPMPEMKETPFKDDPAQEEAKRKTPTKTAGTPRGWYKTSRPTPVYRDAESMPQTIMVGNATPILLRE